MHKNKNSLVVVVMLLLLYSPPLGAQVKVGENPETIDASSLLELESSDRVLVVTRLTNEEMLALTPLVGAIVFNTDEGCIFNFNGTLWNSLCDGAGTGSETGETVTSMVLNENGTYTYTNEVGQETIISFNGSGEPGGGTDVIGEPGGVFFAGTDRRVTEDSEKLYFNEIDGRLGVGTTDPNATVSINGSLATDIQFKSGDAVALTAANHTVIVTANSTVFLPPATPSKGMIFVVKRQPAVENSGIYPVVEVPSGYFDSDSIWQLVVPDEDHVIWFQSNGFLWEQIN